MSREILLRAEHLYKTYETGKKGREVHAVSDVSLEIYKGETLALVGESGCGKSTLGRTLIHMLPATAGSVIYKDMDIAAMSDKQFKPYRRKMQMIFQDPYASLDPRMTVRDIIAEPLETYKICENREKTTEAVLRLMEAVGIPGEFLNRYPHQFSGGQRQRIGIARAIALRPELIICDEPVSALDVSVQSQVLNLLKDIQKDYDLTYLFIGHDLSVVNFMADRVCVMFLGCICEVADKDELYAKPLDLKDASGMPGGIRQEACLRNRKRKVISGEIPSPIDLPKGCCFCTRCPYATEECRSIRPELKDIGGRKVACHHPLEGENR